MNNIISNCPLCGEKSLHIIGEEGSMQTQQCISCGFATSDKFKGTKKDNEVFKTLPEEMQSWSKEANDRVWIPSMITLPFGTLYPLNVDESEGSLEIKTMKWACAHMVDIPKEEQNKYPNPEGGYFSQRYDTDNQKIFNQFIDAMAYMNNVAKENQVPESKIKMPKLRKIDG